MPEIKILGDSPTTEDGLGFDPYVNILLEAINNFDASSPLTIGIYGSWGSGKTSLMRMLEKRFEDDNRVKTIWFNAWAHGREEPIGLALLQQILIEFQKEEQTKEKMGHLIENVGKLLTDAALRKTTGIRFEEAKELFKNSIEVKSTLRNDFETAIGECLPDKRLVVFIDDLDRCLPEKTIEILEVIKLFLDVPRCVFVIGVAEDVIARGIEVRYKTNERDIPIKGIDYIEKIIQIPFILPPIREENMIRFIESLRYLLMFSWKNVPGKDNERLLRFLWDDLDIGWAENAEIRKFDDGKTIRIFKDENSVEIILDEKEEDATLKISGGETYGLKVKKEDGKLNIYSLGISEKEKGYGGYARIVAKGTRYNPRKVKLFLNTLRIRREIADKSGGKLKPALAAKLLVIERTFSKLWDDVIELRKQNLLCKLERLANGIADEELSKELEKSKTLQEYNNNPDLNVLLKEEPFFCRINLESYIYLSGKPPEEEVLVSNELILKVLLSGDSIKIKHAADTIKEKTESEKQQYLNKIIPKLVGKDSVERRNAALALGWIGDAKTVRPLIKRLTEEKDVIVRGEVANALGEIGDVKDVKPLVERLTEEKDKVVRGEVAWALGSIGSDDAVEPLIERLNEKKEEVVVRGKAAEALGKIGNPGAVEPLISALNDEDVNVREKAAEALGKIGSTKSEEALIKALKDKHEPVRYTTAEALGSIGNAEAVEDLISALKDKDKDVRWKAVGALGRIGDPKAVEALIKTSGDDYEPVRYTAREVLVRIGAEAVEPLIEALKDESIKVRYSSASALGRIGDAEAIDALTETSKNDVSTRVRNSAKEALDKIKAKKLYPLQIK